jgi:hypothetical protein
VVRVWGWMVWMLFAFGFDGVGMGEAFWDRLSCLAGVFYSRSRLYVVSYQPSLLV